MTRRNAKDGHDAPVAPLGPDLNPFRGGPKRCPPRVNITVGNRPPGPARADLEPGEQVLVQDCPGGFAGRGRRCDGVVHVVG